MTDDRVLDRYLPAEVRSFVEGEFYARVNEQARLENAIRDPKFLEDPQKHVAVFSDHGVVHVRDVALQILSVLETVNGILIPERQPRRLAFMRGYGVALAYLHDIGMAIHSDFGRAMHPEFAAQAVYTPRFDFVVDTLWEENWGNMAWTLTRLGGKSAREQDPRIVLREMLAMSACHSKSKFPIEVLNDPARLRREMQRKLATSLETQYLEHRARKAKKAWPEAETAPGSAEPADAGNPRLRELYDDFAGESFAWLDSAFPPFSPQGDSDREATRALVLDVVDTLRALRCADALRQRGTVLKTSGNYEVFVDQRSANAVYAMRLGSDRLYLLELSDKISAGEANLASSEIDRDGNLRVSFFRGSFLDDAREQFAADSAAYVVHDIQADVVDSFRRPPGEAEGPAKSSNEILILIEGVTDNLHFAERVYESLLRLSPEAAALARVAPSLQAASDRERELYLRTADPDWDPRRQQEILSRVQSSGHRTEAIDVEKAWDGIKLVELRAGEILVEAGDPAGFVYIPLREGLRIFPLGGYESFLVNAWMPLGSTGAIRGAPRNATIRAEKPVELVMMPNDLYLKYWHQTYGKEEFVRLFAASQET